MGPAMRVILDTNIIVSGLISEHGAPAQLLNAWTDKAFSLVTSTTQITEFQSVIHRPSARPLITPAHAARFIDDLHRFATVLDRLPVVNRSPDPSDNSSWCRQPVARASRGVFCARCLPRTSFAPDHLRRPP
jgi:putative PIN family toxin of toxin-antitoxin system